MNRLNNSELNPLALIVDWPFIEKELENPHSKVLADYLKEKLSPLTKIIDVYDEQGFNLLHHAALKDSEGKIKLLINLYKTGLAEASAN